MSQWFQRLKNFSQQYLNFQPDEEVPEDEAAIAESDAPQPLTDRDYEFLFSQVLEGVAHGWSPERVERFFLALGDRSSPAEWQAWLQRYGAKVLSATTPSADLAQRLIAFGDQTQDLAKWRPLGDTAQGIGRLLLENERGDSDTWDASEIESPANAVPPVQTPLPPPEPAAPVPPVATPPEPPSPVDPPSPTEPPSPATPPATAAVAGTPAASGEKAISLDELLVRLQQDDNLVRQVAQRLGLSTSEPQAIIQELVRQIEQRQTAAAPGPGNEAAEQAFNRGVQAYEGGDFEGAIASWEQAIELKPDYHQAWGNRGLGLKNLGRYEEAIASYDRALELKPDFFKAWYNRGLALDELGRHEEAIASYDEVIQLKPDFHKAWYSRGNSLDNVGSRGEALESYNKALELQPNFHKAWLSRAASFERVGRYSEAVGSYDGALRLKPDDAETWAQRGTCLTLAGDSEEAIASLARALELRPQEPTLIGRRGAARAAAGDWSGALQDYEQSLALNPDLAPVWCSRGEALAALGRPDEAIAAYDRALALQPSLARAWQQRGESLALQGRPAEALTSYDKAIRLQPEDAAAWASRGRALVALDQLEPAIGSYDRALQLQTDDWQLWAGRGEAARQSAQPDLLIASLSAIAQEEPILNQRGFEGEIACLEQGLRQLPGDRNPEGRGRLQWLLGRARYRHGQSLPDPANSWRQALNHYADALTTLVLDTQPLPHLEVLQDRVAVHLGLEEVEQAQLVQQQGLALLQSLLEGDQLPVERQRQMVLALAPLYQYGVDIAVQLGEFGPALAKAEQSKNLALSWLLGQPQLRQALPDWEAIQQLCRPRAAIVVWHLSPTALSTFVLRSGVSEPIVLGRTPNVVLNVVLSPSLRARVNSARENSEASLEILLELLGLTSESAAEPATAPPPPDAAAVDEVADARDRRQRLTAWLQAWDAQLAAENTAPNALPDLLEQLAAILNFDSLLSELEQAGVENLILVPHQELRRLPLHALFPEHLTVATLGTLKMALTNSTTPGTATDPWFKESDTVDWAVTATQSASPPTAGDRSLLSIESPTHAAPDGSVLPMPPGAALETAAICNYCGTFTRLAGEQATRAEVQAALAAGPRLLHYSGYHTDNRYNPQQSALQLNGRDRLPSADWDDLPWSTVYLASFSLPAIALGTPATADVANLASALLSRGVGYVLSALWTTAPEVRVLLMVEFYRRFLRGMPPPQALRQAQQWLRRAMPSELAQWYQERASELADAPGGLTQELQAAAERWQGTAAQNASEPPYAHPHYWAGLTIAARNLDWLT